MTVSETKERILEVAERLFAENGFAATSLRRITSEARANLAAVNYHFGSKEDLIREIFARRLDAVNRERLDLLAEEVRKGGENGPALEEVLRAFVAPAVRRKIGEEEGGSRFRRLVARIHLESDDHEARALFLDRARQTIGRFLPAIERTLPALDGEELRWRFQIAIGAMVHTLAAGPTLHTLWNEKGTVGEEALVDRLVRFMAAGIRQEGGEE